MRFYLISDNSDAKNGMRLAGIEGVVARSAEDVRHALDTVAHTPDIGMVLVTEKISDTYQGILDEARQAQTGPLLVTVPSTGGSDAGKDRITRYVREAIGVKI
ncbi:MAG: V-type ATP synthase subunit F [Faecalibacterium sp.]|jgi:V/A-type H+-transporting ATPase subunit F|nr:V-type ATP synthase subunit F [Faecalibacterium sp.]